MARGDWAAAEAALVEHDELDRAGDVAVLAHWRAVEHGRGTRRRFLERVQAFRARHPRKSDDPTVLVELGQAHKDRSESDEARAAYLAARDALVAAGSDDLRTLSLAEAGIGLSYLSPLDATRARRAFETSRTVAERGGLLDRIAAADMYLAVVELEVGDVDRAARAYRKALAGYERAGDEAGVRLTCYNLGNTLSDLGRDRAARRYLVRSRELSRKRNEPWFAAWATLILGELERKAGRAEAAEAHYTEVEEIFTKVGGPTPTEHAWVSLRRAELALDRGDHRRALSLARVMGDPRVEPTPRLYGRLISAIARAGLGGGRSVIRLFEGVAVDAEAAALNEISFRARAIAARLRIEQVVARRLEGRAPVVSDPEVLAARNDGRRALSTLEGIIGSMRPVGRGAYLRDLARRDDATSLFTLEAIGSLTDKGLLSTSLDARSALLRLLSSIAELARAEAPIDVLRRAVDAVLELAGGRAAYAWIDLDEDLERGELSTGRDADRRELPVKQRPRRERPARGGALVAVRPLRHGDRTVGLLLLEEPIDPHGFSDEALELASALATVAVVLVLAARTRARLVESTVARDEQARELALELARTEVALGDARTRLEGRTHRHDDDGPSRGGILGRSPPMLELFARLDRLRGSELPVIVSGESGTGKELVARLLHDESPRHGGPFVGVNCGALAESLLESELFGHVRGAFTGAARDAPGLFVVADGGTLLLDEVGEMSLAMQAKLLRVLQEREVRPVGGGLARRVDVRVVAATHRDLEEMVQKKQFRQDLFYRLQVLTLHVPPLRVRGDDIVRIARKVLAELAPDKRLAPDAVAWLLSQSWPGNVRELRAVIESAAVLAEREVIDAAVMTPRAGGKKAARVETARVPERLEELEAWAIERALVKHRGSKIRVAEALGIGRATLYRKMIAYGLR